LKNVTLDKFGFQSLLLGEVDGFRKILEINQKNKEEYHTQPLKLQEDKNVKSEEKENGDTLNQASTGKVLEDKDTKMEDKIEFLDDHHENINKIDLPAENCCNIHELDKRNNKTELQIEPCRDMIKDIITKNEENLIETLSKKTETYELNRNDKEYLSNGDNQENDELWEILSSTSITEDKIEVINFDESYNIIPDYFNNK
jgi:hypothetical protein